MLMALLKSTITKCLIFTPDFARRVRTMKLSHIVSGRQQRDRFGIQFHKKRGPRKIIPSAQFYVYHKFHVYLADIILPIQVLYSRLSLA